MVKCKRFFPKVLLKENIIAKPPFYRRWMVVPFTIANQICVGAVYSFSILNDPLSRMLGVIVPSSQDWAIAQIVPMFSIFFCFLGIAAAFGGPILEEVGPRAIGLIASILWGGSWIIGAGMLKLHSLPLLYLQGLFGGIGLGLGYITPVSNLLRWYSDRRGLAGAFSIMGTGAGALIFSPLMQKMLDSYFIPPQYLGSVSSVNTTISSTTGQRFASVNGVLIEVIIASPKDVAKLHTNLQPGVYVVGTGSVGVDLVFLNIGLIFFFVQLISALSFRVPPPDWNPSSLSSTSSSSSSSSKMDSTTTTAKSTTVPKSCAYICSFQVIPGGESIHMNEALKTIQFYLLFIIFFCNITSGIGIIAIAKTIMTDVFETSSNLVDDHFAAGYVAAISFANLIGRFIWSTLSDYLGRKLTFSIFFFFGGLFYFTIPPILENVNSNSLYWYLIATLLNFSFYGGGFSTVTAYISDLFGTLHVGAIHGRILLSWAIAGIAGPMIIAELRDLAVKNCIYSLASLIPREQFVLYFGENSLDQLISSKVVTIGNLMQIVPNGTKDPTSTIYKFGFDFCGGLLIFGFFVNLFIKAPSQKHWESSFSIDGGISPNKVEETEKYFQDNNNNVTMDDQKFRIDDDEEEDIENGRNEQSKLVSLN